MWEREKKKKREGKAGMRREGNKSERRESEFDIFVGGDASE